MRADFITPSTRLQRATKKIQDRWLVTTDEWDDKVSRRFREKYLDPIVPEMTQTLSAIHELMQVLDDAVADTRDDGRT